MYSLSFTGFFKQYRIKNIWSPPGIESRTAYIAHKRSATELRQQPANKHSNSVFVKGYCYATVSGVKIQNWSVCSLAGCLSSAAERLCAMQAVLGSIPGGDQIFLILYCLT